MILGGTWADMRVINCDAWDGKVLGISHSYLFRFGFDMSVTRVWQTTTIKTEIIFHSYSYLSWRTRRRAPTLENESRWHGDRDTPFPLAFRKGEIDLIIIPEWNKINNSGSDNFRAYSIWKEFSSSKCCSLGGTPLIISPSVVETPIIISHAGSPRDTSKHIVVSFFHLFHFLVFYLNLHCFPIPAIWNTLVA